MSSIVTTAAYELAESGERGDQSSLTRRIEGEGKASAVPEAGMEATISSSADAYSAGFSSARMCRCTSSNT